MAELIRDERFVHPSHQAHGCVGVAGVVPPALTDVQRLERCFEVGDCNTWLVDPQPTFTCLPIQCGWKASSDCRCSVVAFGLQPTARFVACKPMDRDSRDLGGRMERVREIDQETLDTALMAFARYKIGEIKIFDLEQAMSFEAGEALSRSGLVRFSIMKMVSGRYRISDEGENSITDAGRDRLQAIRG